MQTIDSFSDEELLVLNKSLDISSFLEYRLIPSQDVTQSFKTYYKEYLNKRYSASMYYLQNTKSKYSPKYIFPEANSMLIVLQPYLHPQTKKIIQKSKYKISRYALGKDYHNTLHNKLKKICKPFKDYRIIVDSTPLPERYYARLANLGFIGKNGMLIHPKKGSYFFLGFVLFRQSLPQTINSLMSKYPQLSPLLHTATEDITNHIVKKDIHQYCKECSKCIDSCPTKAIQEQGFIDSRKCISYHTIESHKVNNMHQKTENYKTKKHSWIFGCDICQTVCPFNKKSILIEEEAFIPSKMTLDIMNITSLTHIKNKEPSLLFNSPLKRIGWKGISKNIQKVESLNRNVKNKKTFTK